MGHGAAEVVQGPGQVSAALVVSAGEPAGPADDRVGPAQRDLVARSLGGGQHGLAVSRRSG